MTIRTLLAAAALCGATALLAQPVIPVAPVAPPAQPLQTPEQLEALVAPIALYPDPLVSIILPAATAPGDIAVADRYLQQGGDTASVDAQTWDESVRAVAHYPELISWLDQNLPWTEQLGAAFLDQPADVMNTIQRLRQNARAAGILVDTPQQQVIVQQDYVYIEPAQPDVIYVPSYDPDIFYSSSRGYGRSAISFALSFATGPWLSYEPDWGHRSIWIDQRRGSRRDWRPPTRSEFAVSFGRQQWRPSVDVSRRPRPAPATTFNQNITNNVVTTARPEVARPTPITRTRNYETRRSTTENPPNTTTFFNPPVARPNVAPPPSRVEAPRNEPVLTPTGRMTEPRVDRERVRSEEERRATPPPATSPEPRERAFQREREAAPAPQATPPQGTPPARLSTPPPQAKGQPPPPPQARPEEPRGKAKGHERDDDNKDGHDNDDRKKRGD